MPTTKELIDAILEYDVKKVQTLLKEKGIEACLNDPAVSDMTPLATAIQATTPMMTQKKEENKKKAIDILNLILSHPVTDVNLPINAGPTEIPLNYVIELGASEELLPILLAHPKIDVNKQGQGYKTPLYNSVEKEDTVAFKLLLEKGADLDIANHLSKKVPPLPSGPSKRPKRVFTPMELAMGKEDFQKIIKEISSKIKGRPS